MEEEIALMLLGLAGRVVRKTCANGTLLALQSLNVKSVFMKHHEHPRTKGGVGRVEAGTGRVRGGKGGQGHCVVSKYIVSFAFKRLPQNHLHRVRVD